MINDKKIISSNAAQSLLDAAYNANCLGRLANGDYVICHENGWFGRDPFELANELCEDIEGIDVLLKAIVEKEIEPPEFDAIWIDGLKIDFSSETNYGEPQAWLYLENGESIEITYEKYNLKPKDYFFSIRKHCNEKDFNNDVYHDTMGVIENYCCDNLKSFINTLKKILERNSPMPIDTKETEQNSPMSINTLEIGNLLFGNSRGNYLVNRCWVDGKWRELMDLMEADYHAYVKNPKLKKYINEQGYFKNEKFIIRPYCWDEDDDAKELPNLEVKDAINGETFTVSWYKYPFRDSYMSHDISQEKWNEIMSSCINSIVVLLDTNVTPNNTTSSNKEKIVPTL